MPKGVRRRVNMWLLGGIVGAVLALAGLVGLTLFLLGRDREVSDQWASVLGLILAYCVAAVSVVTSALHRAAEARRKAEFVHSSVEPAASAQPARVWRVPARNPRLVGRRTELKMIRNGFADRSAMTVEAIRGLGGIGKTQLAIEYAHLYADRYDMVWWIDAEHVDLVPGQYDELAARLGLPVGTGQDVVETVRRELGRRTRWLLIFDNATTPDSLRPLLPDGSGHVLVTTRRAGFGALGGGVINLDVLTRPEATALLQGRVPKMTASQAGRVAELLGNLPLALDQAAAYLERTETSPSSYVELLRTREADILRRGAVLGYPDTVATVWLLSVDQVSLENPAAVELLNLCAWLAPEPIPLSLFAAKPALLPCPLAKVAADPLLLTDAAGILSDYSLLRRDGDSVVLHRLVQSMARGRVGPTDVHRQTALTMLAADLPEEIIGVPESWSKWALLLPHTLAVLEHHGDLDPDPVGAAASLLRRAAIYQRTRGQPLAARPLAERALRIAERINGPEHVTVADALVALGLVLRDLGRPDDARSLYERALRLHRAALGPKHPDCAADLNQLALALRDLCRLDEARAALVQALDIREASYGSQHPTIATTLNHLALVLNLLGESMAARSLLERALAIRQVTLGMDHPEVASDLNQLGTVLRDLAVPAESRTMLKRALRINEATYGKDHPYVARVLVNLALTLDALGRSAEAVPLLHRALAINRAAYGDQHPTVIAAASQLEAFLPR